MSEYWYCTCGQACGDKPKCPACGNPRPELSHSHAVGELQEPEVVEHGFDLTIFEDWPALMAALGLRQDGHSQRDDGTANGFRWVNDRKLVVVTRCNPIDGKYVDGEVCSAQRQGVGGFASYIGIQGPVGQVTLCVKAVHKYAGYIKGESPGTRDYI